MTKSKGNIERILKKCNHVMLKKFKKCGCINRRGLPTSDLDKCYKLSKKRKGCKDFTLCTKLFRHLMSGSEPSLDKISWLKKLISKNQY